MSLFLNIKVDGTDKVKRRFAFYQKLPSDLSPLYNELGQVLRNDWDDDFKTEGKGNWKELADRTVKDRESMGYGGEHPIGQRTGDMRAAATKKGATDNICIIEPKRAEFGFSGHGVYFNGERKIIDVSDTAKKLINRKVHDFVQAAAK